MDFTSKFMIVIAILYPAVLFLLYREFKGYKKYPDNVLKFRKYHRIEYLRKKRTLKKEKDNGNNK